MALKLITGPASEPITLAEAKEHIRVETDFTADDDLITNLIIAAREYCEGFQNIAYITQTWELVLDKFPVKDYIQLPRPPLQSVTSVKYKDYEGTETTLDASKYIVDTDNEPGNVVLAYNESWPSFTPYPTGAVRVRFVAGYGDEAANVPQKVKQAIHLLMGHWYENREAVFTGTISKEIEFAVHALLWQDRVVPV